MSSLNVSGTTELVGDTQVQGNLQVNGKITTINGVPPALSQWGDVTGGINYAGGGLALASHHPTET